MNINMKELMAKYKNVENISALLRPLKHTDINTDEIIEMAYDLQSGTYIPSIWHIYK